MFVLSFFFFFFFQAEDGIRDFHVTGVQTCALPILPTPWWKEPQATSSLGPSPVSRWTGAAAGLVAWPKRFSESLMWFRDICVLSILRCGDGLPRQSETAKKKIKGKRTDKKHRQYRPG